MIISLMVGVVAGALIFCAYMAQLMKSVPDCNEDFVFF